jgi:hypothetical protein
VVLKRALGGLTVIAAGLILLANTTGYLPWTVWVGVVALWPLLLVAAGIDVLGKALDNEWLRAIGSLVVLVGLVYGALAGQGAVPPLGVPFLRPGTPQTQSVAEPGDETVRTGTATITAGPGRFTLAPDTHGLLAHATGRSLFGGPSMSVDHDADAVAVTVQPAQGGQPRVGDASDAQLAVTLASNVQWKAVRVNAGLSQATLTLRTFLIDDLVVDGGLSSTDIVLGPPHPGKTQQVHISGGLSSVRLQVPDAVSAEAEIDNGLGSTNLGAGWERVSGDGGHSVWRTVPTQGARSLHIVIGAGLSTVSISRYRFMTEPGQSS